MSADRNLLFGILALQMDFITRDRLIAAMHAWVLDKTKPLGDILSNGGMLAADECQLIDALVQKHVCKHGNDLHASLAAASPLPPAVRDQLGAIADAEVQRSLGHVTAAPVGTSSSS